MAINFQGKTTFVGQLIAAVQSAADAVVDSSVGSVTLALAQAVTGVALWLQAFIAKVLLLTRAATSKGSDLDSWFADWGFFRLPAVAATSTAIFARATPTLQAVVPVGQGITTGPGGVQFAVTLDPTNPAYSPTLNGYVLAPSVSSVTVPIACATAGMIGNVLAGTVTSFLTPIPGVDTVINPSNITNGANAESDPAFRTRFVVYLAGLASSDMAAIESAIANVQQGIFYALFENLDYPGDTTDNGSFFVIIDDGTGYPPTSLLDAVTTAIQNVRGFTIRFQGVYAPTVIAPAIVLAIRVANGYSATPVQNAVQSAIVAMVNAIELDTATLFISEIEAAALAVTGCQAVKPSNTTINAAQSDLSLTVVQVPRISGTNVTVNTY